MDEDKMHRYFDIPRINLINDFLSILEAEPNESAAGLHYLARRAPCFLEAYLPLFCQVYGYMVAAMLPREAGSVEKCRDVGNGGGASPSTSPRGVAKKLLIGPHPMIPVF